MLIRQRTILRLIEKANQPLSSTVVFKLAFLLRQETAIADDPTFYDFFPYRFGPYSFAMHREIESLISCGYLEGGKTNTGLRLTPGRVVVEYSRSLAIEAAIDKTLARYLRTPQRELVRDVYARYPWYAVNSELVELRTVPLPERKRADLAIYTIGYHKTSVDSFINRLLREGIGKVLDVRANPVSRKYGFAGSSLGAICRKVGLSYEHFPGLGIPSSKRKGVFGTTAFGDLFSYYEQHILAKNQRDLTTVSALMREVPSALLCAEQNPAECHRSRLASAVSNSTGLLVIDL
jgi:uncharacterized protein (DUF488 family)